MPLQLPSTPSPTTTYLNSRGKIPSPRHASMDDLISLHCRITALETELRLTKEKLIDSQNGTLYLVNLVDRNHRLVVQADQDQEIQTLRCQLDEALESNAQLRRMLATAEWSKKTLETGEEREETASSQVVEGDDLVGDLLGSISEEEEEEHDEMSKIQNDFSCSVSEKGVRDGWANIQRKIDEKRVDIPKEPAIKRVRFLDHEHNRLAGSACFINDLTDPVEYEEYWIEYATKHQDRTAEEWKHYYESQIRPSRFETGTAQPVHMHLYSKDDVKQYDIPMPVQPVPVDSPLQHFKWSSPQQPISRWPAPQPREHIRSPYAGNSYLSYEVMHLPASRDVGLRRTVLVSNIRIGMILADILAELVSDRILEAKFAGTAGMKTIPPIMTNAAIVEFLDNEDAQAYVDEYCKHEVFEVRLIASPTRPLRRSRVDSGYN